MIKKVASKNNPNLRKKSVDLIYNGKKIVPIKFIDHINKITINGCAYEEGEMVKDKQGNYIKYIDMVRYISTQEKIKS